MYELYNQWAFSLCFSIIVEVYYNASYYVFHIRHIGKYSWLKNAKLFMHLSLAGKIIVTAYFLVCLTLRWTKWSLNACARLICNSCQYSRCSLLLLDLHWLFIQQRIAFKVLLITSHSWFSTNMYNQEVMISLSNVLPSQKFTRPHIVDLPSRTSIATLGDWAFIYSAPKLWNNLSPCITQSYSLDVFKSKLKTHFVFCIFSLHFV